MPRKVDGGPAISLDNYTAQIGDPMPFVPPGYAQFSFVYTLAGDQEGMMFGLGISWDDAVFLGDVAEDIRAVWETIMVPSLGITYTFQGVTAVGTTSGGIEVAAEAMDPAPGTSATAKLPQNCALLVKKTTGLRGRSNRGRMFVPGHLSDDVVDDTGTIASGTVTAYQTALTNVRTTVEALAGVTALALLHTSAAETPTLITELVVDPVIATQRRRLRR